MIEYLENIVRSRSIDALWDHHVAAMAKFGFTRLIYLCTHSRTDDAPSSIEDLLILSNQPADYVKAFIAAQGPISAHTARWAYRSGGVQSWKAVFDASTELDERAQKIRALNQKYDLTAGFTISFQDASVRVRGGIGISGDAGTPQDALDAIWAEHGRVIHMMNIVAHLKIINLPHSNVQSALTPRQRQVLEWIGDGKTVQDTAVIMGLTPATVEKHLRLARNSLGVDTTAHAIQKASFQNQIFAFKL